MSDLLKQIDAAAALGAKATKGRWEATPEEFRVAIRNPIHIIAVLAHNKQERTVQAKADCRYIVAAANLDLAAVAAELRRLQEIEKAARRFQTIVLQRRKDEDESAASGATYGLDELATADENLAAALAQPGATP